MLTGDQGVVKIEKYSARGEKRDNLQLILKTAGPWANLTEQAILANDDAFTHLLHPCMPSQIRFTRVHLQQDLVFLHPNHLFNQRQPRVKLDLRTWTRFQPPRKEVLIFIQTSVQAVEVLHPLHILIITQVIIRSWTQWNCCLTVFATRNRVTLRMTNVRFKRRMKFHCDDCCDQRLHNSFFCLKNWSSPESCRSYSKKLKFLLDV